MDSSTTFNGKYRKLLFVGVHFKMYLIVGRQRLQDFSENETL